MSERSPSATQTESDAPASFDAGLDQLEDIVARLEQGELALEESLAVFERGVRLTRCLAEQLQQAERRVEILIREGDESVAQTLPDAEGSRS